MAPVTLEAGVQSHLGDTAKPLPGCVFFAATPMLPAQPPASGRILVHQRLERRHFFIQGCSSTSSSFLGWVFRDKLRQAKDLGDAPSLRYATSRNMREVTVKYL